MSTPLPEPGHTTRLVNLHKAGDPDGRNRLVAHACKRMQKLARRMLPQYRRVRRWEETADVVQSAVLRLYRALETVEVHDSAHFHRLAALQLRWELLDLCKKHNGPNGMGANHHTDHPKPGEEAGKVIDRTPSPGGPSTLDEWTHFHEAVDALPSDEKEVVQLRWYHGLSHDEIAGVLGVSKKTSERRWVNAMCLIGNAMRR